MNAAARKNRCRPNLETLEDRLLMSVFGSYDWSHVAPSKSDGYPYSAAVSIYYRNSDGSMGSKLGSGAMVGPNTVLTAAHVLYDTDTNTYRNNLMVVPGQVGDWKPYGAAASTSILTVSGYTQNHDTRYDVGLIYLDRNLGNFTGSYGLMSKPESFFDNRGFVNILHYPADTLAGDRLVYSKGYVSHGTPDFIRYNGTLDTEHGSSGAPVYVIQNGKRYIVGVHHQGNSGGYNQAVRLDSFWFNTIVNNKNIRPTYDYADLMDRDAWFDTRNSSIAVKSGKLTTTAYVWNGGTAAARSFNVHFYASSNNIISTSDYYLGSVKFNSLKAFQTGKATLKTAFPSHIPGGVYNIGWIIDGNGTVGEYRENNNTGLVLNQTLTVGAVYRASTAQISWESALPSMQQVPVQTLTEAASPTTEAAIPLIPGVKTVTPLTGVPFKELQRDIVDNVFSPSNSECWAELMHNSFPSSLVA